jgi:hypothetical protein
MEVSRQIRKGLSEMEEIKAERKKRRQSKPMKTVRRQGYGKKKIKKGQILSNIGE